MDSQQHTAQVGSLAFPSPLPWGLCVALAGLEIPTQTKLTSNSDICLFLPPVGLSTFQPTSCVTLGKLPSFCAYFSSSNMCKN